MIEAHWIYIGLFFIVTGLIFFSTGGINLWRNQVAVKKKLRTLEKMRDDSPHTEDARALQIVITHVEAIRSKWILNSEDLDIVNRSMELTREVASVYRPESPSPAEEVRLGKLLDALLFAKNQTRQWNQNKTVATLFNLRLRHLFFLAEAWEKKKNWDQSRSGRAFYKYRLGTVIHWLYTVIRFMDISFWLMKMLIHWFRGYALKQLLLSWTLLVGETAYQLYREIDNDIAATEEEKVWNRFDGMASPETPVNLPPGLQRIVSASRNELLFETSVLKKERALEIYRNLAENIARWHHPKSIEPLKEARLIDVAVAAGRLLERIEALRDHPAAGHLFRLRVSHVLRAKGLADQWQDSEVKEWADKYKLDTAVKISSILYKAIRKHPGTLFKTAALELLKESGKRWFYIYLHGKLTEETHRVYQASAQTPDIEENNP
jgi:hypothetical protein